MKWPWSFCVERGYNCSCKLAITWGRMPVKRFDAGIRAAVTLVLVATFSSGLALGQERSDSGLTFSIDGDRLGIFSVNMDPGIGEVVTYDLLSGEIQFSVGDVTLGEYHDPLFCFGASDQGSSQVNLRVLDANGHLVVENFGLPSSLQYILGNNEIAVKPQSGSSCFYMGSDDTFGLFGMMREDGPEDAILLDRFEEGLPELVVEYLEPSNTVTAGDEVTYFLTIRNESDSVTARELAFQEVYPSNESVYGATLVDDVESSYSWSCSSSGGDDYCPQSFGSGSIRFSGAELPPSGWITFEVTRSVAVNPAIGVETIDLYAGVVAGTGGRLQFDTAEHTFEVLGQPAALLFHQQPGNTNAGMAIDPPVVVHVVDANNNLVTTDSGTNVRISLLRNGSPVSAFAPVEVPTVAGVAEFSDLVMDQDPGEGYVLRAVWDNYQDLPLARSSTDFVILDE
jgi:hypothetical protein